MSGAFLGSFLEALLAQARSLREGEPCPTAVPAETQPRPALTKRSSCAALAPPKRPAASPSRQGTLLRP